MMTRKWRPRSAALGAAALLTLGLGASRVCAHPADAPPPPITWEAHGGPEIPPPPPPPPMVRQLDRLDDVAHLTPRQEREAMRLMRRAREDMRPLMREMARGRRAMREARLHDAPPRQLEEMARHQRAMRREMAGMRMRMHHELMQRLGPEQRDAVRDEMRGRMRERREMGREGRGPGAWDGDLRERRDELRRERDELRRRRDELRERRDDMRRDRGDDRRDDDGWEDVK